MPAGQNSAATGKSTARSTGREQLRGEVGLVTFGLRQDGARMAIPKSHFRPGILSSERRETPTGGIQVLEALQFQVLSVCVRDQDVVNSVRRERNLCRHGALLPTR